MSRRFRSRFSRSVRRNNLTHRQLKEELQRSTFPVATATIVELHMRNLYCSMIILATIALAACGDEAPAEDNTKNDDPVVVVTPEPLKITIEIPKELRESDTVTIIVSANDELHDGLLVVNYRNQSVDESSGLEIKTTRNPYDSWSWQVKNVLLPQTGYFVSLTATDKNGKPVSEHKSFTTKAAKVDLPDSLIITDFAIETKTSAVGEVSFLANKLVAAEVYVSSDGQFFGQSGTIIPLELKDGRYQLQFWNDNNNKFARVIIFTPDGSEVRRFESGLKQVPYEIVGGTYDVGSTIAMVSWRAQGITLSEVHLYCYSPGGIAADAHYYYSTAERPSNGSLALERLNPATSYNCSVWGRDSATGLRVQSGSFQLLTL